MALVRGDHLLTTAYRCATRTGSPHFVERFAMAVERTVAGEIAHGRAAGRFLDLAEYHAIARGKAGELLGCALSVAPTILAPARTTEFHELGAGFGVVYQMLDDLLDLCPSTDTGKPALSDFAQRHWTWPRAVGAVEREAASIGESSDSGQTPSGALLDRVPRDGELRAFFARHSRSFSFATLFFSSADSAGVARVYAFCRCTDDLADAPELDAAHSSALLNEWLTLSRRAYAGHTTGIGFLDRVMSEMAAAGVPFVYVEELVEGMRMDLLGDRYASLADLRRYTYRVASVVGLWISELFDVRDPDTLRRAEAMGHAMQLTNIIRDVGEDLRAGRRYLPADLMRRHGVSAESLAAATVPPAGCAALMEELIAAADAAYRVGFAGIPRLPRSLRLPVGVAAHVYRGILAEVRRLGYDNLGQRAHTSAGRKLLLAARALHRCWQGVPDGSRREC